MKLRKSNVRLIALSAFYLLYIIIGASVFSAIEGPKERELVKELRNLRNAFLTDNKCLTGNCCKQFTYLTSPLKPLVRF